jgi:phosphatidylserine/phosphatidylglycerophosphate/cardiolipin synthase-like enzyme
MRNAAIRVGGSELLLVFLEQAVRIEAKRLHVLSPYVDDAVFADDAIRRAWTELLTIAQTTIVVRTAVSAEAVLRSIPPRMHRPDVRVNRRLHAKVFVARRFGAQVALVGSQNLTGAALHVNEELGILINAATSDEHREIVRQLCHMVDAFGQTSGPVSESGQARPDRMRSRAERRPPPTVVHLGPADRIFSNVP